MELSILLISMIFCHIVDDYYLQGFLASAKQKKWWEQNAPAPLYKDDYLMALFEHAFSWTFMIHVPIFVYGFILGIQFNIYLFVFVFAFNLIVHGITDNAKENLNKINLTQDQEIHLFQIINTWVLYVLMYFK